MSERLLSNLSSSLGFTSAAAGVFAVLCGILAWYFSSRHSKLVQRRASDFNTRGGISRAQAKKLTLSRLTKLASRFRLAAEWLTALTALCALPAWYFSWKLADIKDAQSTEYRERSTHSLAEAARLASLAERKADNANDEVERFRTQQGPRKLDEKVLVNFLRGKPKMKAEVLYQPDDMEAYGAASKIAKWLGYGDKGDGAGWEVTGPRKFRPEDRLSDWSNGDEPIGIQVGAFAGVGLIISEELNRRLPPGADMSESNPVGALSIAMMLAGIEIPIVAPDKRLPTDTLRVVVGTKGW